MVLTWVDLLIVLVVIGAVLWEVRRDFGHSLLDTVAVLLSLRAAMLIWPAAARAMPLGVTDATNRGLWLLLSFLLCAGIGLFLARLAHQATRWSLDTFDPVFGFVFGITAAVIACHVIVKAIAIMYADKHGLPQSVAQSALGQELLTFRSYHHLVEFLSRFPNRV
jgi:Co/Zn/Cd efflux system component